MLVPFSFLFFQVVVSESVPGIWPNATTRSFRTQSTQPGDSQILPAPSSTSPTVHSNRLGDFVAAGIGITSPSSIGVAITALHEPQIASNGSVSSSRTLDMASNNTSPSDTAMLGNLTMSPTDDCWQQWTSYWSATDPIVRTSVSSWSSIQTTTGTAYSYTYEVEFSAATETSTVYDGTHPQATSIRVFSAPSISDNSWATETWTSVSTIQGAITFTTVDNPMPTATTSYWNHVQSITQTLYDYTYENGVIPETITTTVYNGAHPQKTFITVISVPAQLSSSSWATATWTSIGTVQDATVIAISKTLVTPSCSLPDVVPACQSSWDEWYSQKSGLRPACTQARVTGSACSADIDDFLNNMEDRGRVTDGVLKPEATISSYTTRVGTADQATTIMTTSWFWDPDREFAPGCSLGCQKCQINGGTVQLLYWPPQSTSQAVGNHSAATANGTMSTLVTLGTTLTSPTVYVSFDSLYARDSCSAFGKTYTDQIVAITDTATLSSLYGWNFYNGLLSSASFNFTDLYASPVPDEIYQSQPRCASSMAQFGKWSAAGGGWVLGPANWTCPRTADYDPILSIPNEVRAKDPAWRDCVGGIDGAYDPPIALTPVDSLAKPTMPVVVSSSAVEAAPASSPKPTGPRVTASSTTEAANDSRSSHSDKPVESSHLNGPTSSGRDGSTDPTTLAAPPAQSASSQAPQASDTIVMTQQDKPTGTTDPVSDPEPSQTELSALPESQNPTISRNDDPKSLSAQRDHPSQADSRQFPQAANTDSLPHTALVDVTFAQGGSISTMDAQSTTQREISTGAQTTFIKESGEPSDGQSPEQTGESQRSGQNEVQTTDALQPTNVRPGRTTAQVPPPPGSDETSTGSVETIASGQNSDSTVDALSVLISALSSAGNAIGTEDPHEDAGKSAGVDPTLSSANSQAEKPHVVDAATEDVIQSSDNFRSLTNQGPESTANALSVLESALSSAKDPLGTEEPFADPGDLGGVKTVASPTKPQESQAKPSDAVGSATQDVVSLSNSRVIGESSVSSDHGGPPVIPAQSENSEALATRESAGPSQTGIHATSLNAVDTSPTQPTGEAADAFAQITVLTVGEQLITASRSGSVLVLADGIQKATALPGQTARLGSQDFELYSDGTHLVADTAILAIPSRVSDTPTDVVTTWSKDGSIYSAVLHGSSAEVKGPHGTTTLLAGAKATIAGEILGFPGSNSMIRHGGYTASFKSASAAETVATWSKDGSIYSAALHGSSAELNGPHETTTLLPGAQATFAGEVVSLAESASVLVHGEHTVFFWPTIADPASGLESAVSELDAYKISAAGSADESAVLVHQASTTFTLDAGHQTKVGGHSFSAGSDALSVVVDGSRTTLLPIAPTTAARSTGTSRSESGTEEARTSEVEATMGASTSSADNAAETSGAESTTSADANAEGASQSLSLRTWHTSPVLLLALITALIGL